MGDICPPHPVPPYLLVPSLSPKHVASGDIIKMKSARSFIMIKELSKERDLLVLTHEPKREIGLICSRTKEGYWTHLLTNQRGRLDSLAHKPKREIGLTCSRTKEGDWTHLLMNQRGRLDLLTHEPKREIGLICS